MRQRYAIYALSFMLGLGAAGATAQTPGKPIRIAVPFRAGSQMESATRMIADALSQSLGRPLVVAFRPGADGHTLLLGAGTTLSMVPVIRQTPPTIR